MNEDPDKSDGVVISLSRGHASVLLNGGIVECELAGEIASEQRTRIAVGDHVKVGGTPPDPRRVEEVLPRRTVLSRPDPHRDDLERVIAANIDLVVHVVSLKSPPLRQGLIDRYLIAITRGGTLPAICVNKVDLANNQKTLDGQRVLLEPYTSLEIPVVLCSVRTGLGLDELRSVIDGQLSVFVGHSGVGKSSLLNALDEGLDLETAEVSSARGTGRHTTRTSTLHDLGGGTLVIDTPGIRELGLWDVTPENLRFFFPEFVDFSLECRFRNCSHSHEPVCAVRSAAERGEIARARYEAYLRLLTELDR